MRFLPALFAVLAALSGIQAMPDEELVACFSDISTFLGMNLGVVSLEEANALNSRGSAIFDSFCRRMEPAMLRFGSHPVQSASPTSSLPASAPSAEPDSSLREESTHEPSAKPSNSHSEEPTYEPTARPSNSHSKAPTYRPTARPSSFPDFKQARVSKEIRPKHTQQHGDAVPISLSSPGGIRGAKVVRSTNHDKKGSPKGGEDDVARGKNDKKGSGHSRRLLVDPNYPSEDEVSALYSEAGFSGNTFDRLVGGLTERYALCTFEPLTTQGLVLSKNSLLAVLSAPNPPFTFYIPAAATQNKLRVILVA